MDIFKKFGRVIFERILRAAIGLRYKVEVKGMDSLLPQRLNRSQGTLFLPNHPAQMDAIILFSLFWRKFRIRPLIVEYMYRNPLLRLFKNSINGLPIPDFDASVNQWKLKKAEDAMKKIAGGLREGNNFYLYPAGNLKSEGRELLKGSSAAHSLIQECPDVNIVLIRTTGLWGSSFSRAQIGRSPDLGQMFVQGFKTVLKNLIFFSPRRKVLIEIESNPIDFPRSASRIEFNHYLENWYNRYSDAQGNIRASEPLNLISYSIWRKELPEVFQKNERKETDIRPVSAETIKKVYGQIRRILDNPNLEINPSMSLAYDLGMDSLNIADLSGYLLKNYEIEDFRPGLLQTVHDVLEIAEGAQIAASLSIPAGSYHFPEELGRPDPSLPTGRTIVESFLNICDKMGPFTACGDDLSGVLSYKKMKRAVLVLSAYFKTIPDESIAIMLPASTGAFIAILALQAAGKIPVMLNWTLGPKFLEEMIKISGARRIITSWRFLDRLSQVDFGSTIDQMQFLEDIRDGLSLKMKLRGALLAKLPTKKILSSLQLEDQDENNPCVILFTSGSESVPKCVPLSHANVLSMIRPSFTALGEVKSSDCAYVILPPFHSFGFGAVGLLSLLSGVKAAFYPDPTNSRALSEGIRRWNITILPSPPSFLMRLFNIAKDEELKSVRLFLCGAEKSLLDITSRIEKLNSTMIEGYGITECSAIVSMNSPASPIKGLGKVLSHFEYCTIHPDTLELLAEGSEGEICLRGPSVFTGYIGSSRSAFIDIDGKKWYRTGDLGFIDKDRVLFLSGRLKRFAKLGGEMISLAAIEEVLVKEFLERGQIVPEVHSLVVCSDDSVAGNSRLVLFTITSIEKETVNEILKKAGFSNLVKISIVKKVNEIPVLATGKMDYRHLQTLV